MTTHRRLTKSIPTSLSLSMSIEHYLDDLRLLNRRPKTINGYRKHLSPFLRWCAEHQITTFSELTVRSLKTYIRYLQTKSRWSETTRGDAQQLSAGAVYNVVADIRHFLSWALRQNIAADLIPSLLAIATPKRDEYLPVPFTDAELTILFTSFSSEDPYALRDKLIFLLFLDTGMRQGEVANLRIDHIDMEAREILIPVTKNRRWRRIGVGLETIRQLRYYLKFIRPQCAEQGESHVFVSATGKPMNEHFYQYLCRRYAGKLGIHIHSHRFRHTFAVNMLKSGVDIRTLQQLLGHSDIRITSRYLQLSQADLVASHHQHSLGDIWGRPPMPQGLRLKKRRSDTVSAAM